MKKILFISLLLGHISHGQTITRNTNSISMDIHSDSLNNSPNIVFNDKIKIEQINKSIAKVDIRLYKFFSLSNTKSVLRIFLIDTTWKAVEFGECGKFKEIKMYNLVSKYGFDSLVSQLLSYNILTLPNQTALKNKMHKNVQVGEDGYPTENKVSVADGEYYTIEIEAENKFRVYQFDNPDIYSKFYTNVSELKDYLNIVDTFDKFLERQ